MNPERKYMTDCCKMADRAEINSQRLLNNIQWMIEIDSGFCDREGYHILPYTLSEELHKLAVETKKISYRMEQIHNILKESME